MNEDRPVPRWVAPLFLALGALTVPWTAFLAVTLPDHARTQNYREAWVGFDIMLVAALLATAYLAWRGRRSVALVASATATMLVLDAWFDVLTSRRSEVGWSIASALLAELPLAVLCGWIALHADQVAERRLDLLASRIARLRRTTADPATATADPATADPASPASTASRAFTASAASTASPATAEPADYASPASGDSLTGSPAINRSSAGVSFTGASEPTVPVRDRTAATNSSFTASPATNSSLTGSSFTGTPEPTAPVRDRTAATSGAIDQDAGAATDREVAVGDAAVRAAQAGRAVASLAEQTAQAAAHVAEERVR